MKFLGVNSLKELVVGNKENKPQKIIESDIKEYLVYLRTKKKTSYNTSFFVSVCNQKILLC